ncbi:glutamate 5-kinase [Faecalibaculum rodentium]|uniref:glutamate 5-kinase n=1 Tax=Faecalibaculum rodentium TaxID=1702221 RepID=UPI003F66EAE9
MKSYLKPGSRIVVKVGSSSLRHGATGRLDLYKLEVLVRQLANLRNAGLDVVLVSSGAMMAGRTALGIDSLRTLSQKQAAASVGQARLMMIYSKLFSEYNTVASQVLMTKNTVADPEHKQNARNTFEELLAMGVIPIVNENDTVSTYEIQFGDNDTLSAVVSELVQADLLVLLSDIDGLFTSDPNTDPEAELVREVLEVDESLLGMAGDSASDVGTGGMRTKLQAARMAMDAGTDMMIANGRDFRVIHDLVSGRGTGTWFRAPEENRRKRDSSRERECRG